MNAVRSLKWRILLSLAFIINLYKVNCSESRISKADNGLKQTITDNRMPENVRKEEEQEILTLFGPHQRPNSIEMNAIEKSSTRFMLDLYNKIRSDNEDKRSGMEPSRFNSAFNDTFESDINEISGTDLVMSFDNHPHKLHFLQQERDRVFYFDFSNVSPGDIVTNAELKLYKEPSKDRKRSNCLIEVFRIRRGNDSKDKNLEPEANLTVSNDYEGWISIKVTNAANYWTVYRTENLGLYMRVTDIKMGEDIDPDKYGIVGEDGPKSKKLFMVGFYKMSNEQHMWRTRSARIRQNLLPIEEESRKGYYRRELEESRKSADQQKTSQSCRRHQLYVNFTRLGWNSWIIAPTGYNAFYCAGECKFPLVDHMNATQHATVQSIIHSINPNIPKPCCVPTKLSAVRLLQTANSTVLLLPYEEMVVEACGCH